MAANTNAAKRIAEIREQQHLSRLLGLREAATDLLMQHPGSSLWLFGSLARGDWDACSDIDLLAIAGDQVGADRLADAVLAQGLADDVIALTTAAWQRLATGADPYWRAIGRDAIRLEQP
jgi:predicted nucleotidyltransferase